MRVGGGDTTAADARDLRALILEPCSPFPESHVVEQEYWSLLDPVK